jgi:hypothetical protein
MEPFMAESLRERLGYWLLKMSPFDKFLLTQSKGRPFLRRLFDIAHHEYLTTIKEIQTCGRYGHVTKDVADKILFYDYDRSVRLTPKDPTRVKLRLLK